MLVSCCTGLSGHTIQPTSLKNAYPPSSSRRHIRRYWPCAAGFLLYPDPELAAQWWQGIQYTGILRKIRVSGATESVKELEEFQHSVFTPLVHKEMKNFASFTVIKRRINEK